MGNLCAEPDVRYMPDGKAVVSFTLACNERWKDKATGESKEHCEFIRCACFGKRGEAIGQYVSKGQQLYIEGKQRTRKYEKSGQDHYATEIVVDDFQFCGSKSESSSPKPPANKPLQTHQPADTYGSQPPTYDADMDDDLPFAALTSLIRGHLI